VDRQLDDLDGRKVTGADGDVGGRRDLRQADGARVRVARGPEDAELGNHGQAHVQRAVIGAVGAEAEVDEDLRLGVALEPAGLEGDGTACRGPVRPVRGGGDAAA
jgi:hypothetical protein